MTFDSLNHSFDIFTIKITFKVKLFLTKYKMRKFHSLRLKLLGVVDGADVELLKVDAENEPKFI